MDLQNMKSKKNDARKPDIVTAELKKGFEWTTSHTSIVIGVVIAFVVIGGGYSLWRVMSVRSEKELQTKYFELESQVGKKKEAFEAAKAPKNPLQPKEDKKPTPAPATGDLAKDYGDLPKQLLDFAEKNPKSKAGAMAVLTASGILAEYKKPEEAIPTLKKVQTSGILSGLVSMQLATLLANTGKCDEASPVFEKIVAGSETSFLKLEAKLKLAICAEQSGNLVKAEQGFLQVVDEGKGNSYARSAQKYMRLLQFKKTVEAKTN